MGYDLEKAMSVGYSYEDITKELAPQQNFNIKKAQIAGFSYQQIAESLATKDYPDQTDTYKALETKFPRHAESLDLTDRHRILDFVDSLPGSVALEVRKEAVHEMRKRKYGAISQNWPSFVQMLDNIPKSIASVVADFSSLLIGLPIITWKTMVQLGEESYKAHKRKELPVGTDIPEEFEEKPIYILQKFKEWAVSSNISVNEFFAKPFKEQALLAGFALEKDPASAALLANLAYSLTGGIIRVGAGVAGRVGIPGAKALLSTTRTGLPIGNIIVERHFAKNPLTKLFIQKPFDAVIGRYPRMKATLIRHRTGKMVSEMRRTYDELNFTERVKMHKEVYENIEKLNKKEREIMIPLLEGRLHFRKDLKGDVQGLVDMWRGKAKPPPGKPPIDKLKLDQTRVPFKVPPTKPPKKPTWSEGITDTGGESIPLYHGTRANITLENIKPGTGGAAGPGIYLSKSPKLANLFAGEREGARVLKVYATKGRYLKLPFGEAINAPKWAAKARKEGYAGLDTGLGEVVVFNRKNLVYKKPLLKTKIPEKIIKTPFSKQTPETLAKKLGVKYNGIQEYDPGEFYAHMFTDNKTGSTFNVRIKNPKIADIKLKLDQTRAGFEVPSTKPLGKVKELLKDETGSIPFKFAGAKTRWGRGTENINPQRVREFEAWYGGFQERIKNGFKLHEKMTPEQLDDVLYQPIEIETGLPRAVIKKELGDFTPAYVHHYFPERAGKELGIHFATTTGKRFKPSMLKKRTGALGYSEDLAEVLPRVASSYIKWKNTEAFLEEFTHTFGVSVNLKDIKVFKEGLRVKGVLYSNHKIVAPDGFLRFYKGEIDVWKEITKRMNQTTDFDEALMDVLFDIKAGLGPIKKDYLGATKNIGVYLVPQEVVSKLETIARPAFGTQGRQNILKIANDAPIQVFKDSVLALSPRWIKNNVVGDIIFNTMENVGPMSYIRGVTAKYQKVIPDEILRASFANVMKYNPKLGKAAETTIGHYLQTIGETKPVRIAAGVKNIGYAINTACEQPFVRALYVNIARKKAKLLLKAEGKHIDTTSILTKMIEIKESPALKAGLIKKIKETLPVFSLLDDFGRKYGRRAIPFLNWYKFMAEYAATLPAKHPFKLVGIRGMSALTEKERQESFKQFFPQMANIIDREGELPRRFDGLWPIGKDEKTGETIFFNARGMNPFTTLEDFINLRAFSMMSPIIKVAAERTLGIDTFTGQKFTSDAPIDVTPEAKVREIEKILPPFFQHIAEQFPQFQLLEQFLTPAVQYSTGTIFNPKPKLDPITGEPKYPINTMDKILNYMGIDKKTIDIEKWFYKHDQRIKNKMAITHKNLLFDPEALSLEEHRLILRELQNDKVLWNKLIQSIQKQAQYNAKKEKEKRGF